MVDQQYVQNLENATNESWDIPSFEESNQAFELPDEGYYRLRLMGVGQPEPVLAQYDPTGTKKRAMFTFQIEENGDPADENIGILVRKWFTISMNEKSSLYPFIKAMKGGKIDPAERINPNRLVGSTFMGVIKHDEKEPGKVYPTIEAPTVDKAAWAAKNGEVQAPF